MDEGLRDRLEALKRELEKERQNINLQLAIVALKGRVSELEREVSFLQGRLEESKRLYVSGGIGYPPQMVGVQYPPPQIPAGPIKTSDPMPDPARVFCSTGETQTT